MITNKRTQHDKTIHPIQTLMTLSLRTALIRPVVVRCISVIVKLFQSSFDVHSGIAVSYLDQHLEEQSLRITSHQFRSSTQRSKLVHVDIKEEVFMHNSSQYLPQSEHVCLNTAKPLIVEVVFRCGPVQLGMG